MPESILLLQGPVGSFFRRFADDLQDAGHTVYKVNLNAGDAYFYRGNNTFEYRGTPEHWPIWLDIKLRDLGIDRIYLFGDCRSYHRAAKKIASQLGIRLFVFECGYIRPDFITLEEGGVNGYSAMPTDQESYRNTAATPPRGPHALKGDFGKGFRASMMYYIASSLGSRRFPHYRHHRPLNVRGEGMRWTWSYIKKMFSVRKDLKAVAMLLSPESPKYFFVPLQVHGDMQVTEHSRYCDVAEFIDEVVASFAACAPETHHLVFKHHPLDRAYRNYSKQLAELSAKYQLGSRILYIHDGHLPDLLQNAEGTITINSTVGLSSLHEKTPVICMGKATYNINGLCFQGKLDQFWQRPGSVDWELFYHFRAWLMRHNQVKGSLYQKLPESHSPSGLIWPTKMQREHLYPLRKHAPAADPLPSSPLREFELEIENNAARVAS